MTNLLDGVKSAEIKITKEVKILSEYLGDFQNLSILIEAIKNGYIEIFDEAQRKEKACQRQMRRMSMAGYLWR